MSAVRVLICDDSLGFPTLVETWLRDDERFEVVGRANGGEQAKEQVAQQHPDVILLDLLLPDAPDPPKLVSELRTLYPALRVMIVSSLQAELLQEAAHAAGADGHIHKGATAAELTGRLYAVARPDGGGG
jgi:two-component system response regulator (stage 0 sporulation protein A)